MAQFLRFATLIILAVIGFGSGICGLFGLGATALDSLQRRGGSSAENMTGLVIVISLIGIVIAVGCFFGARALARSLRAHATPVATATPPHVPPTVPPTPPPAPPAA